MKLQADFVGLIAARGLKLVVGLATIFVYARMFGVSATYDAWIWSLGLISAANVLLFGPITETIRASYSAIDNQDGRTAAEEYLATIAIIMIGTAILVATASVIALPPLAKILVPEQTEQGKFSIYFLYALAPSIVLSQIVVVLTAHLNCHGKVYQPEFAGIAGGIVGVSFIIACPDLPAPLLLLGSYYITVAAPILVGASFWSELLRALGHLKLAPFLRYANESLMFSLPLLLPYAVGQLSGLIERQYALAAGTGALSVLSYAFFARATVQAVFTAALSALAVPSLAKVWNREHTSPFRSSVVHWLHQCLMLATVGMVTLYGLSDLAPTLLFGNRIGAESQLLLGTLFRYYSIAILAVVLYLVAGAALLAARRGRSYAVYGTVACVLSIILLVVLFPSMGILAVPAALGVSHLFAALLMFHAIDSGNARHVLSSTALRAVVVLAGGTALLEIDRFLLFSDFTPLARLPIGAGIAGLFCGLWLAAEYYLGRLRVLRSAL